MGKKNKEFKDRIRRAARINLFDVERQTHEHELSLDELEAIVEAERKDAEKQLEAYKKVKKGNNNKKSKVEKIPYNKYTMKAEREAMMAEAEERKMKYQQVVYQQLRNMQEDNER